MIVDGIDKTAYAARQALACRALAGAVPDPHAKRIVARGAFIAVVNFIEIIRQTRNSAVPTKVNKKPLVDLKSRINEFAERDWGLYADLRHRISAHRQTIGGVDGAEGWQAANELWGKVDAPLIGVLCDDLVEIYENLRDAVGGAVVTAPSLPEDVVTAITSDPVFATTERGIMVDVGSFGQTRRGRIVAIQLGDIGERNRQIADTIDAFEVYLTLLQHVRGQPDFERPVRAGLVIETCNYVELALDVPSTRALANFFPPLVDLLQPGRPGWAELDAAKASLDANEVEWARILRNEIAAHVAADRHLPNLVASLDACDLARLWQLWHHVDEALAASASVPGSVVSPIRMRGVRLSRWSWKFGDGGPGVIVTQ